MNGSGPISRLRDRVTGHAVAELHAGSWPSGVESAGVIERPMIVQHSGERPPPPVLTGPELVERARRRAPGVVEHVADLRRRVLAAIDELEGGADQAGIVAVLGVGVVAEVGRMRGDLRDLRVGGVTQHVSRASATVERAWVAMPKVVGTRRRPWRPEMALKAAAEVATELRLAWMALADAAVVLEVNVAAAPPDRAAGWWERAEELAVALREVTGMVCRAVGPDRRASGQHANATASLGQAELELLRLSNVVGQLVTDFDDKAEVDRGG